MEQRVSLITLGVADLERARAFYEALGWTTGADPGDDVVFFQAGGMVIAPSWPRTARWRTAEAGAGSRPPTTCAPRMRSTR
jgi:catechol 2,3-dioxygenase-like lactoylglutathione lyase family enzyme